MEEQAIQLIIATVLPILGGLIIAIKKWFNVSEKIKLLKNLIDSVDDALRDDKITESEFRTIFGKYKALVKL